MNSTEPLRIVFMGTPDFAVASLEKLITSGYHIAAVITSPDKPAGRGMKIHVSAVKKFALEHSLKLLQPVNLKDEGFLEALRDIRADLQIVVAFRMLPEVVWNMPPMGTINLHASLLPQYRGAAPINHAIINGEKVTGVTTFRLKHDIDTGNILLQEKIAITEDDNAGTLHDKLMNTGADLLLETIQSLKKGTLKEISQEQAGQSETLVSAPKIYRSDCEIDWNKNTEQVYNFIRGLTPYPGAFTFFDEKRLIISLTKKEFSDGPEATGAFRSDGKTYLKFRTSDGYINVLRLKPEGKREMDIRDFLRGRRDIIPRGNE